MSSDRVLEVRDLSVSYGRTRHSANDGPVVDEVSFGIAAGTVLGLVGESGSGKTTIARAVMGMVRPQAGSIVIAGHSVGAGERYPRKLRRRVQMIFQDPYSSLNPVWPVGRSIAEPLRVHHLAGREERPKRVERALEIVGMDPSALNRRPRAFSGGQRQRIAIARAIITEPDVLVCDEPTSALDVSTQNQILVLLRDLVERLEIAVLFISHDLAVTRQISSEIAVLSQGRIVEMGPADRLLDAPQHPYTRLLRESVPSHPGGGHGARAGASG